MMLTADFARPHRSPMGYVVECQGMWVRAHLRCAATVITMSGQLSDANVGCVGAHLGRFATLGSPLAVDVRAVHDAHGLLPDVMRALNTRCAHHDVDWVLVGQPYGRRIHVLPEATQFRRILTVADAVGHLVTAARRRRCALTHPRPAPPITAAALVLLPRPDS